MVEVAGQSGGQRRGEVSAEPWKTGKGREYREDSMLGKGAYGIVYLVTHVPTGQQYALKKMSLTISEEGVPQSVLREISALVALRRIRHTNIMYLHEVFHGVSATGTDLHISLVVEKCDWDLYSFLKDIPRDMPEHQCRLLARQIVAGVDYLHSNNIIHRDLKPQNILINKDQTVKIADFGLSRAFSTCSAFTTVVVTLWYRSPELLLQCPYNTAVDMWSVGCILSELYSRTPLFPGQTEAQQLGMIFQKLGLPPTGCWPAEAIVQRASFPPHSSQPLRQLCPRLAGDGIALLRSCLEFTPHYRISARDALKHPYFMQGEPARGF